MREEDLKEAAKTILDPYIHKGKPYEKLKTYEESIQEVIQALSKARAEGEA